MDKKNLLISTAIAAAFTMGVGTSAVQAGGKGKCFMVTKDAMKGACGVSPDLVKKIKDKKMMEWLEKHKDLHHSCQGENIAHWNLMSEKECKEYYEKHKDHQHKDSPQSGPIWIKK